MKQFFPIAVVLGTLAFASGKIEVVGPSTIDFGKYPAREKKVAKYKIKNVGDDVLKILKVRKTCGCAYATADKKELKPDETATVEVGILPNTIFHLYSKNNFVESNDPNNRFLKLTVAGNAIPLVKIKPKQFVYAGRIKAEKGWSQTFDLVGTQSDVRLGSITTNSNRAVEAILSSAGEKESNRYKLSIALKPTKESGDFRCSVRIPVVTPTNNPPITVSVSAKMGKQLNIVPGRVFIPLSDTPVTKRFSLWVLGQRTRVLKPEELKLPENKEITYDVKQDNRRRGLVVTATFSSEFTKTLYADENIPLDFSVPGAASAKFVCLIKR